jgi:hypothetical protein
MQDSSNFKFSLPSEVRHVCIYRRHRLAADAPFPALNFLDDDPRYGCILSPSMATMESVSQQASRSAYPQFRFQNLGLGK